MRSLLILRKIRIGLMVTSFPNTENFPCLKLKNTVCCSFLSSAQDHNRQSFPGVNKRVNRTDEANEFAATARESKIRTKSSKIIN